MIRSILLFAALTAAGCEVPDTLDPTNPYDPKAENRIVTGPIRLEVGATSPTSVTLSWRDRSSFEAGFEIQEVVDGYPNPSVKIYKSVAAVPRDEVSHVLGGLTGTADLRFRVVATDAEEQWSAPTNEIALRYPREQVQLPSGGQGNIAASFAIGGETMYTWSSQDGPLQAYDIVNRRLLYEVEGRVHSVHPLSDGRSVLLGPVTSHYAAPVRAQMLSRTGAGQTVLLESATAVCRSFSVSMDGSRIAASCPVDASPAVTVWNLASGALVKTFSVGPSTGSGVELVVLSPAGDRVVVGGFYNGPGLWVFDVETESLVWRMDRHSQNLPTVAFVGAYLVVSEVGSANSFSGKIKTSVFLAQTGELLSERQSEVGHGLFAVEDGRFAYGDVTEDTEVVRIVSLPDLDEIRSMPADLDRMRSARLLSDGFVLVKRDGGIERWDFTKPWEVEPN